jgi:hypothetical protein
VDSSATTREPDLEVPGGPSFRQAGAGIGVGGRSRDLVNEATPAPSASSRHRRDRLVHSALPKARRPRAPPDDPTAVRLSSGDAGLRSGAFQWLTEFIPGRSFGAAALGVVRLTLVPNDCELAVPGILIPILPSNTVLPG